MVNHPYPAAVQARRSLSLQMCPSAQAKHFKTLAEAGWEGDYVTPNQISSCSPTGPVLLLDNWIGWDSARRWDDEKRKEIKSLGYNPTLETNGRIDGALRELSQRLGWNVERSDIYITQASLFLAPSDSERHPKECYRVSISNVVALETGGRRVVSACSEGTKIMRELGKTEGHDFVPCKHPSRESHFNLANALQWAAQV